MPDPDFNRVQSYTERAVIGTGWSMLAVVGRQALSVISMAIVARRVGPGAYGLMGMAAIVTNFLANFRDLGTATAIIQRPEVSQRFLSTVFWANFVFGLFLTGSVLAISIPTAHFFHEPALAHIMQMLSLSFWLTSSSVVHGAILTREMNFRTLSVIDFGSAVTGYAAAIGLAVAGFGVWSLVWANLVSVTTIVVLYWWSIGWRPSMEVDWAELRSISGFSLNLSGFGLVNYFSRNADNLIVGRFLGSTSLGYYQMAYTLMLFPLQNISSVIAQVTFPAFARFQDDNSRFRSAYIRSSMLIALVTFPVMAGLAVVAGPFVQSVLGSKWIPVVPVLAILAPAGLIQSIQTLIGQIYTSKGRTDWMFRWGLFAAAVLVPAFLVGVRWGIIGVASAYTLACLLLLLCPSLLIPFRLIELRLRDFVRALWKQLAVTGAMAGCCFLFLKCLASADPRIQLSATVAVGIISYLLLLRWVKPAVLSEVCSILVQLKLQRLSERFALLFGVCPADGGHVQTGA
jgi:PST family polysaccharide transporter